MKNKFQRFGALLCACLIFVLSFFFFVPFESRAAFLRPSREFVYVIDIDYTFDSYQQWQLTGNFFKDDIAYYLDVIAYFADIYEEDGQEIGPGFVVQCHNADGDYVFEVSAYDLFVFTENNIVPSDLLQAFNFACFGSPLILNSFRSTFSSDLVFNFVFDNQQFVSIDNGLLSMRFVRADGTFYQVTDNDLGKYITFDGFLYPNNNSEYRTILSRFSVYIPPSFLDRVTSGLTAVIGWVGAVASAVISGPLSPLLGLVAVGIAVSAILLVIYLVRRFIWGA